MITRVTSQQHSAKIYTFIYMLYNIIIFFLEDSLGVLK